MERGWHGTELSATRRRSLARRATVYGKRRPVHLGHAARQVGRQVSDQPAQVVVLEFGSRDRQWRLSSDVSPEAAAESRCQSHKIACYPNIMRGMFGYSASGLCSRFWSL